MHTSLGLLPEITLSTTSLNSSAISLAGVLFGAATGVTGFAFGSSPALKALIAASKSAPPDAALLDAAINALRAGEDPKAKPVTPAAAPNKTPASEIAELFREVVDKVISGSTPSEMCITLTYVDTHGMSSNRIVEPIRFEGGLLTGFDLTESRIRDYAISRIAGAEKGKK